MRETMDLNYFIIRLQLTKSVWVLSECFVTMSVLCGCNHSLTTAGKDAQTFNRLFFRVSVFTFSVSSTSWACRVKRVVWVNTTYGSVIYINQIYDLTHRDAYTYCIYVLNLIWIPQHQKMCRETVSDAILRCNNLSSWSVLRLLHLKMCTFATVPWSQTAEMYLPCTALMFV